ncbi:hypothetical protein [Marinobacter caseinilyticus]|uniref:hypothetical protein n=1 Tax=Marinobacter caseinilyticus TaxID=2692195 RepID=UPI001407F3FD|nr:hypothetical protein [Marinobacter caseinilyticus]
MKKDKSDLIVPDYTRAIFPKGWAHFLGAVMSMMPALVLVFMSFSTLFLEGQNVSVRAGVILGGILLLAVMLSHSTFLLTRGKRWARPFVRWYHNACILLLLLGLVIQFFQGNQSQHYPGLVGLTFALVSFALYRSNGFALFCDHYCELWEDYRQRQKSV